MNGSAKGTWDFIMSENIEPLSFIDSTEISPPKAIANFLLRVSPKPHPSLFIYLFSLIFLKALNKVGISLGSIPTPVSFT